MPFGVEPGRWRGRWGSAVRPGEEGCGNVGGGAKSRCEALEKIGGDGESCFWLLSRDHIHQGTQQE